MHELGGSFMPFMSYPWLLWADLYSSAKGLLQAVLSCAVLLFQDVLSDTHTSLRAMNMKAKPTCSDTMHMQELWRPLAAGTDWGGGLDSSSQERNRNVFTLKSFSLLEVLFETKVYFTACFTNISSWWRLLFSTPHWKGISCISSDW